MPLPCASFWAFSFAVRHFQQQMFTGYDIVEFEELFAARPVIRLATAAADGVLEPAQPRPDFCLTDDGFEQVRQLEDQTDIYEDALGSYLVKLNNKDLSPIDSRSVSVILHCINDFERISDHAVNIMESAKEMHDKKLAFSKNAMAEFDVFKSAVHKIVHMAVHAYADNDLENAKMVEPLEQVINGLNAEMKQRHIRRLRKGKCTIELGWVLQDLLTNIERVSDHCSNIAICIIEVKEDEFDTHSYLEELKENNFKWFKHALIVYKDKFALPENVIDEEESVVSIIKKEDSKK